MSVETVLTGLNAYTLAGYELAGMPRGATDEQIKRAVDRLTKKRRELASAMRMLDHALGHITNRERQCFCSQDEIRAVYEGTEQSTAETPACAAQ